MPLLNFFLNFISQFSELKYFISITNRHYQLIVSKFLHSCFPYWQQTYQSYQYSLSYYMFVCLFLQANQLLIFDWNHLLLPKLKAALLPLIILVFSLLLFLHFSAYIITLSFRFPMWVLGLPFPMSVTAVLPTVGVIPSALFDSFPD